MKQILALITLTLSVLAADVTFNRELILPGQVTFNTEQESRSYQIKPAAGVEFLIRRADDYGDFLIENYQIRFSYDLSKDSPKESWALELHNFWWEFKLNLGKRLRVGHLQPHFGLESSLDSHGKFFQTLAMKSMGMKHDWGASYSRYFGVLDFAGSVTLGNGMSLHKYDDTYLVTARLSSPDREVFRGGISLLVGETVQAMGMKTFPQPMKMGTMKRALFGLDGRYRGIKSELLFETYLGTIKEQLAGGFMLRSEIPAKEKLRFLLQGTATYDRYKKGRRSEVTGFGGINLIPMKKLSFESQFGVTYNYSADEITPVVRLQLYYFGV